MPCFYIDVMEVDENASEITAIENCQDSSQEMMQVDDDEPPSSKFGSNEVYSNVVQAIKFQNSQSLMEASQLLLSKNDDSLTKRIVETAFRGVGLELLSMEAPIEELFSLLDFSLKVCKEGIGSKATFFFILSDMCEVRFDDYESIYKFLIEREALLHELLLIPSCNSYLLRIVNSMLKRLSRIINAELCGRLSAFLTKCLPFLDKSGLNATGECEPLLDAELISFPDEDEELVEQFAESAYYLRDEFITLPEKTEEKKFNRSLYSSFCLTKKLLAEPTNCCETEDDWSQFKQAVDKVLTHMSHPPLPFDRTYSSLMNQAVARELSLPGGFYLPEPKMFMLQINDVSFVSTFLMEQLIVLDYLIEQNRCLNTTVHDLESSSGKHRWLLSTYNNCYQLLKAMPDGEAATFHLNLQLDNEKLWGQWKRDNYPDVRVKPTALVQSLRRGEHRPYVKGFFDLGNPTLTKLWNLCPNNVDSWRGIGCQAVPEVKAFISEAVNQASPEMQMPMELKKVSDENFKWIGYRFMAEKSRSFGMFTEKQILNTSKYLESMLVVTAMDLSLPSDWDYNLFDHTFFKEVIPDVYVLNALFFGGTSKSRIFMFDGLVTQDLVQKLATKLAHKWKEILPHLKLSADVQLACKNCSVPADSFKTMMTAWIRNGKDATIRNLRSALLQAEVYDESIAKVLLFRTNPRP
ncbi:THO complex subunit 1 [Trichinella sp. T9]|nr:THO complex subunit 1 [Trichinella sp. T9]